MFATPSTSPSTEDSLEDGELAACGGAPASCSSPQQQQRGVPPVVGPERASNPTPRADLNLNLVAGPVIATPPPAPRASPPTPHPPTAEGPALSPPRTFRGHVERGKERVVEQAPASHTYFERLFSALDPPALRRLLDDDATRARVPRDHHAGVARNALVEMKKAAKGATALRALRRALDRGARLEHPRVAKTQPREETRDADRGVVPRGVAQEVGRRVPREAPREEPREESLDAPREDFSSSSAVAVFASDEVALAMARDASAAAAAGKPLAFLFPDGALWRKRDRSPERFPPDAEAEAFFRDVEGAGEEDDENDDADENDENDDADENDDDENDADENDDAAAEKRVGVAAFAATPPPASVRVVVPSRSPGSHRSRAPRLNESATAAAAAAAAAAASSASAAPPRELPFRVGAVVVLALGRVDPVLSARASSSSSYVLPVGFVSRREYGSVRDPDARVWYESRVEVERPRMSAGARATIRGGGGGGGGGGGAGAAVGSNGARIAVRVSDCEDPSVCFVGPSPTHAWQQVIRAVNERAQTRKRAAVSGPQFLGLTSPAVAEEIAKLPGYAECRRAMDAAAAMTQKANARTNKASSGEATARDASRRRD